ncbi:hypothetical protein [Novosphingobium sp. PP1Y]|uniref:hypothetical protein n=1 Tax=Novosphingobium sp. PP1Y TaxID=702113 RepID=UPI0002F7DCCB|nr:hypothetical protein [Novosphingobium sp. PP1Y]
MIASVGPELPLDLLQATGRYAGPLGWNVDRDMPLAAQWLESKFPRWSFSILEDWAIGALDSYEAVVFSRANDAAQRLYYYVCELQRRGAIGGPRPLICDVARIARGSSLDHAVSAIGKLADQLGVDDAALEQAIVAGNRHRVQAHAPEGRLCLLGGTAPPDRRIHAMIEAAGWVPAGPTLADQWSDAGPVVVENTGDPHAALGQAMHARHGGGRGFFARGEAIVEAVQTNGAEAVVLWFAEEDETEIWHLPEQRQALEAAGIPLLSLTRRDWRANDGVDAQIAGFLGGLGA